jgi:hypothetical protein
MDIKKISPERFDPPEAVDAIPLISGQIARSLIRQKDDIFRAAITLALKTSEWAEAEIIPRCSIQRVSKSEVIHLDDKPLIQFFPPDIQSAENDLTVMIHGNQKYRMLWFADN